MALQLSVAVRNARGASVEATIGTAPILKIATGAPPANCAASASGTVLSTLTLPSDWLAAPSSGVTSKSGTWQDLSADAAGVAAHWRIYASDGTTCHMQGTATMTGGGGDMTLDNTNLAAGQAFSITAFSLTEPDA